MRSFSLAIIVAFFSFSCNNNPDNTDTVKAADAASDSRADSNTHSDGKALPATDEASASFLTDASDGSSMEVVLRTMSGYKAGNQSIKDLGAMMVKNHGDTSREIRDLAMARTVTLPQNNPDKNTRMIEEVLAKAGEDFEKAYINIMADDHKKRCP